MSNRTALFVILSKDGDGEREMERERQREREMEREREGLHVDNQQHNIYHIHHTYFTLLISLHSLNVYLVGISIITSDIAAYHSSCKKSSQCKCIFQNKLNLIIIVISLICAFLYNCSCLRTNYTRHT